MLPRRAYLGVELPPDSDAFCDGKLVIAGVLAGGMAAAAGLAAGDRVVEIAGVPMRELCDLGEALRRAATRDAVVLVAERAGSRFEIAARPVAAPRDPGVTYGELVASPAIRLRTLATTAAHARAVIVMIGGIACESVESGSFAELAHAWTRGGYHTLRFDKRGVGDSEGGPCRDVDFATELADARAVVAHARTQGLPVVVFGHSVGGIIAAQLAAEGVAADALIVYGTPVTRWLDCLRDSTRRQLELQHANAELIVRRVAALDELVTRGELNGRSAAYHAQLDALDHEAAWRAVTAPVLVVRGEHDWVVAAEDQARIVELTDAVDHAARPPADGLGDAARRPADARRQIVDVPRLDHVLGAHADREASLHDYGAGASDDAVAVATLDWLDALDFTRPLDSLDRAR